jgi:hypothetical protein
LIAGDLREPNFVIEPLDYYELNLGDLLKIGLTKVFVCCSKNASLEIERV